MSLAIVALLAALILAGIAAFHAALALGQPWGQYAWGGQAEGKLPPRLQLGSTILTPIVGAMALIVLIRGGWLYTGQAPSMVLAVWGVFLFLMTQFFGALRSESKRERQRMTAVYALGAALTAYLNLGGIA
jgi:hypothetical protein